VAKVFAQSVRDALVRITDSGTKAHRIPNQARQTLLRNGLVDIADGDEENVIVLTKVGRAMQEILIELAEAKEAMERLKGSALAGLLTPVQHQGRAAAVPAHRTVGGKRPVSLCGELNTDSFAAFLARLEAAGKNRWRDPHFQGEAPARE
jgi:hypothetical protein